nr:phosphotransferase [Nocardia transvalensis]
MGASPLAEPDWPPPELDEIAEVVPHSGRPEPVSVEWRSPRPLSSTSLVRTGGERLVVKRLPIALRDTAALAEEHAYMDHLRAHGIPVPRVPRTVTRGEFVYETQEVGTGADLYRRSFSWSPYLSVAQAAASGRMLARLHHAAEGYDAPARPPRPLQAGLCTDLVATVEEWAARRPELADFLAAHRWREDIAALRSESHPLRAEVPDLPALWTHNDWHGTNLLWTGDEVTAVIDFGLANRTTAVFDVATAIERFAVDWLSLRAGGPARVPVDQLTAFLDAYRAARPLSDAEREALPALFPLVHVVYELSEIEYFLTVLPRPNHENADIAYRDHLLGHLRWAGSGAGREFLGLLSALCYRPV